jgi:hypothetical protein
MSDYADYYVLRALQQGWQELSNQGQPLWDILFPDTLPQTDREVARTELLRTGIQFRADHVIGISHENETVISVALDDMTFHEKNTLAMGDIPDAAWELVRANISVYLVSRNKQLMRALSRVSRSILRTYIRNGWFYRAGFDDLLWRGATELAVPEGMLPEGVTRYVRKLSWSSITPDTLPDVTGFITPVIKTATVNDSTTTTNAVIDRVTGTTITFAEFAVGGVHPEGG